ncbi:YheT family hydrolase [Synoicihabitans lomoniglobus]|uniref:Alpha/beta fold hydrolase n=1 Tax=Synoicihabitans lomoniglobus TaxID=2909285 RepID=A0AAE9ZSE0_9BACT|nr:alpha/beta fold hydrolase [Opitutaceae bacterium LMO-M01]WED63376.1 alpha/beta fold hydrolase [Opitutaceae bacterium LMO-M01]
MPLIESTYRAPWGCANGHVQSIVPALWRRVPAVPMERVRIATPDDDFIDLDCVREGSGRVAIISHGLEGNSRQPYVQGMARALVKRGWDVIAWNCRGCSGEMNRRLRFYHSGASEDLAVVVDHALANSSWRRVALVGFSLGGNMTLKYLGERGAAVDPRIHAAATFSVPCDLAASSVRLGHWSNRLYMERFMRTLRGKVLAKAVNYPAELDTTHLAAMRTFKNFDDRYTAPLHGFTSAEDYWHRSGSVKFLAAIRVRSLLVNAHDDPFLAGECFPGNIADASEHFHLETPRHGGHVGFITRGASGEYWSETRAAEFLETA